MKAKLLATHQTHPEQEGQTMKESTLKADLHVHSRYSKRPSQWILRKLGASESYIWAEDVKYYRACDFFDGRSPPNLRRLRRLARATPVPTRLSCVPSPAG